VWNDYHIRNDLPNWDKRVIRECHDYPVWHAGDGSWPYTQWKFEKEFKPGVILDIGGCIGAFSVIAKRRFPDCRPIVLEPVQENRDLCELNLRNVDPDENWQVINAVLNYFPEKAQFINSTDCSGGGIVVSGQEFKKIENGADARYSAYHDFSAINFTLAELVEIAGGRVDILKMDCEGGENGLIVNPDDEYEVSADIELLKDIPLIVGEWHGHEVAKPGDGYCNSRLVNALIDHIGHTHNVIAYDSRHGDGIGNFFCWKKGM
tara:strand:- start:42 stop:830 length:789 start_codon:yes stop_codon:yes gene_type:complete